MATTTAPSFNPTKDQGKALLALWQPTQGSQPAAAAAPKPKPPHKRKRARAREAKQTTLPDILSDDEDEEPAKTRIKNIKDDDDDDSADGATDHLGMSDPEDGIMSTGPHEGAAAGAAGKGFVLDPTVEDDDIRRQFALLEDARTGEPPHEFNKWHDMHLLDGDIDDDIMPQYIEYLQSRGVSTKGIDHLA